MFDSSLFNTESAALPQDRAAYGKPVISLIVCTLDESESICGVLEEAGAALCLYPHEIVVVDDSADERTASAVLGYRPTFGRVRLLRRHGERGLASACIAGWAAAEGRLLAVCDGDGQHDLSILPAMIETLDRERLDLVAASRYLEGRTGLSWMRDAMSRAATVATQTLLRGLTDPMSGFFVMRREVFAASRPRLAAVGFKILVDIVASHPGRLRLGERPAALRARQHGESKLDIGVIADLFGLLVEKATHGLIPSRFALFAAVGASGVAVHMAVLAPLQALGSFVVAQGAAILTAMTWNFVLNNLLTFRDKRLRGEAFWTGLISFYLACLVGAVISEGVAGLLHGQHVHWAVAGGCGALAASLWNYFASRGATWNVGEPLLRRPLKPRASKL